MTRRWVSAHPVHAIQPRRIHFGGPGQVGNDAGEAPEPGGHPEPVHPKDTGTISENGFQAGVRAGTAADRRSEGGAGGCGGEEPEMRTSEENVLRTT